MNDADSPQGQDTGERGSECEHEWIFCHDYDTDTDMERPFVECRVCGQNAGNDTGEIRIHETQGRFMQHPEMNWTYTARSPFRFQGTGLNKWYPCEE